MLKAKLADGSFVLSYELQKATDSYFCPCCGETVIFVNPVLRIIKHFRHKRGSDCILRGSAESKEHLKMKAAMLAKFKLPAKHLEVRISDQIADLFYNNYDKTTDRYYPVAIECQHSRITTRKFIERTEKYTEKGIYVLWIFDHKLKCTTPFFKNVVSKLYFGRVYTLYLHNDNLRTVYPNLPRYDNCAIIDEFDGCLNKGRKYGRMNINYNCNCLEVEHPLFNNPVKIARFWDKHINKI